MGLLTNLPLPESYLTWQLWGERLIGSLRDAFVQSPDPLVGGLVLYKGAVPQGILPCNGSTFLQSNYPALYQQLGGGTLPSIAPTGGFNYGIKAL